MNKMATEPMTGAATEDAPKVRRTLRVPKNFASARTILLLIVPALLILGGAYYWLTSGGSVSTDDAQVKQDIVSVSPQVTGPIQQVFVRNGSQVKRGQLLYRIDPAPFHVALEQAQAQLANARLQTTQLQTQAAGTGADIVGEQANLAIKRNAIRLRVDAEQQVAAVNLGAVADEHLDDLAVHLRADRDDVLLDLRVVG